MCILCKIKNPQKYLHICRKSSNFAPEIATTKFLHSADGHLPEIQSAIDMLQNGVNMSEFQIQLLQKIEELTLYTIQQEERIKELEKNQNVGGL